MTDQDIVSQSNTPAIKAERLLKLVDLKKKVDEEYDQLRRELLESMRGTDTYAIKTSTFHLIRSKRTTTSVVSIEDLEDEFKRRGLEFRTKAVPDDTTMNTVKQMVKDGEEVDGVEVSETEYVSIKSSK
jgi:hypothetical protein